jgi:plasmid stabilization system protein ParE
MRYRVRVLRRAQQDIIDIRFWIADRSPEGSTRWYRALSDAVEQLRRDAGQFGVAAESEELGTVIYERLFKTRRGRPYRIIYSIASQEVRILRVRGPGQAPVSKDDLRE